MSLASVIHFANVTKRFGTMRAVADASFKVMPGEIVGFVGPNGAGKTTTISMMLGFINASSGSITLLGEQNIRSSTAHKTHKNIGYCAGDISMFENLTGEQYLAFNAGRFGLHADVQKRLINRLEPQLGTKIKKLSRGNKQKIALIAALQHDPELIILDEPTAGLDPLMQDVFLNIIKEEAARGATVFMSSHILSEVASVCSRVLFMKSGKIIVDKKISEVELNAGKIITIHGVKIAALPKESVLLDSSAATTEFRYNGDLQSLLRWINSIKPKDITIVDRDLDDIFKDMYREET